MKVEYIACDICGEKDAKSMEIQFVNRSTFPEFLSLKKIDICNFCLNKLINGNALYTFGTGINLKLHWFDEGE